MLQRWNLMASAGNWAPFHSLREESNKKAITLSKCHQRRNVALSFWQFIKSEALPISWMRAQGQINMSHSATTVWWVNSLWCVCCQALTLWTWPSGQRKYHGRTFSVVNYYRNVATQGLLCLFGLLHWFHLCVFSFPCRLNFVNTMWKCVESVRRLD